MQHWQRVYYHHSHSAERDSSHTRNLNKDRNWTWIPDQAFIYNKAFDTAELYMEFGHVSSWVNIANYTRIPPPPLGSSFPSLEDEQFPVTSVAVNYILRRKSQAKIWFSFSKQDSIIRPGPLKAWTRYYLNSLVFDMEKNHKSQSFKASLHKTPCCTMGPQIRRLFFS